MLIDSNVWIYHNWCTAVYVEMWLRHINICMEYTRLTVHHFCHFQFLTLVLSHEVTVWSCRKENVNRYSEQILLVSGLWIYGTLRLRRLCLRQLWIVWRIDLIGTVFISDTVITGKISSFNDQSAGLSGLSWTAPLLLLLLLLLLNRTRGNNVTMRIFTSRPTGGKVPCEQRTICEKSTTPCPCQVWTVACRVLEENDINQQWHHKDRLRHHPMSSNLFTGKYV